MRCWSTGLDVGWMMKTSAPRMFSSIWNDTSLSGNRRRRACPSVMPRKSAISRDSCGWALPEKIFSSPNPVAISPSPLSGRLTSARSAHELVGAEGFEPSNTGSKVPRLTAWPRPSIRPYGPAAISGQPPAPRGSELSALTHAGPWTRLAAKSPECCRSCLTRAAQTLSVVGTWGHGQHANAVTLGSRPPPA